MSVQHFTNPIPGYNVILPAVRIDLPRYIDHLTFFQTNVAVLVHYVTNNWPIFTTPRDDDAYEFVTEEITQGASIFRPVRARNFEDEVSDMLWFEHFTGLMEVIFQIREQLMPGLVQFIDPKDEAWMPSVTCRACREDAVVLHIQPELSI